MQCLHFYSYLTGYKIKILRCLKILQNKTKAVNKKNGTKETSFFAAAAVADLDP